MKPATGPEQRRRRGAVFAAGAGCALLDDGGEVGRRLRALGTVHGAIAEPSMPALPPIVEDW